MLKSNIGWLLDKNQISREQLAKKYGKSRNTISNWCTGKSKPNADELFELAKDLKVKVDDLYEEI